LETSLQVARLDAERPSECNHNDIGVEVEVRLQVYGLVDLLHALNVPRPTPGLIRAYSL
jgi:hypothetical protein